MQRAMTLTEVFGLLDIQGNDVCCDCREADPEWASLGHGVLLCLNCAGIHRGLPHANVRSMKLDKWTKNDLKAIMTLGNKKQNAIFEMYYAGSPPRPSPSSSMEERSRFITAKWKLQSFRHDESCFIPQPPSPIPQSPP